MDIAIEQLQPELAQSWEISPDKKVWTFKLRPGVKWQKGYGEVTADDVKFSYERQLDPALGGVHGASFKDIASIEVVNPLTVRFKLKDSNAFLHATALTPGFGRFVVRARRSRRWARSSDARRWAADPSSLPSTARRKRSS